ncbi:ATP-grasp domain-containing protein [Paenibacillus sp. GCM10023248]|uniref:ATP-grasp domain-containing protein n=1 Tax=Bacillales TaxID=1385 RepID=UPI0023793248|nr:MULTISPECIES: ATP-grasp domain-containing protein [Bacillales]MDD9271229.1 ATP-grasp domain-containing protein [Paenibacillus sp. MAHUQ-63]MDR6881651.1 biotin carboxylase [Bacillus sp. 3255]
MKKVWFNRWFSVAYHYMNSIRNNEDGMAFKMYATHPDRAHMALQAADYADTEPVLGDDDYIEFALGFCKQHGIDVFIPRLHMYAIAKHLDEFEKIGTRVTVCRDLELLENLLEKQKFYEAIRDKNILSIPDYHVVNTADQFMDAYKSLSHAGHQVCMKPTNAEGGTGFRIISNERNALKDLFGTVTPYLTSDQAYRTLSSVERFDDLMVMELLGGYEYSIDCLATASGELLAAVPRRKADGRLRVLEEVPELIEIANKVAAAYRIPFNYNIQVKYNQGVPKLLEINPRMSGGLHVTCLSGINFPYLAVKSILGGQVEIQKPRFGITASHIETYMIMNLGE